jgi:large subunit ribosomal protein L22
MKTQATAKFVGTSARKTGLVAALIRGRRALDAQTILANTPKRAAVPVGKVLISAIANAENNHGARAGELIVESVLIGPGPTLKRARPRAKGSSAPIMKRSSHITVVVTDGRSAAKLVRGSAKPETSPEKSSLVNNASADSDTGRTKAVKKTKKEEAK